MTSSSARHAAIILAAGASRRLGMSKQLLLVDGEPLVRRAARAALATEPMQTLVVVGKEAESVFAAVNDLAVERIDCIEWAEGMSASLRSGVAALSDDCDGVMVVLCDQPALTSTHLQTLVATWRSTPQLAVASAYANTLGVPAILPRSWFADIEKLQGDHGARDLLRKRVESVIAVAAPNLERDIDVRQDLL